MWNQCVSEEYDHLIGRDLSNLQNWQRLCEEVGFTGVKEALTSITKCKTVSFLFSFFALHFFYGVEENGGADCVQALSKVYVNLVDLLDCRRTGTKVKTFKSIKELSEYTKRSNQFFNRNVAKRDKLLRVLLRVLV